VTASVRALSRVGTPYQSTSREWVSAQLESQGGTLVASLERTGIETTWDREIVALIAYLQRLGTDGRRILQERSATPASAGAGAGAGAGGAR
jgi:cytochrome c oxidase cbb3-type subunit I/II